MGRTTICCFNARVGRNRGEMSSEGGRARRLRCRRALSYWGTYCNLLQGQGDGRPRVYRPRPIERTLNPRRFKRARGVESQTRSVLYADRPHVLFSRPPHFYMLSLPLPPINLLTCQTNLAYFEAGTDFLRKNDENFGLCLFFI